MGIKKIFFEYIRHPSKAIRKVRYHQHTICANIYFHLSAVFDYSTSQDDRVVSTGSQDGRVVSTGSQDGRVVSTGSQDGRVVSTGKIGRAHV